MKSIIKKFNKQIKWYKNLSKIKQISIVIIIAIAIILLISKSSDEETTSYQIQPVQLGSITQIISETGEIMSTGRTDVVSTTTGIVDMVYVDNDDVIYKGQNLFKVISSATQEERSKAYASYLSAKSTLELAKANKLSYESDMWQAHESFESQSLDTELSVDDPIFIQTERDWQASESKYLNQDQVISAAQASVTQTWLAYQATVDSMVKAPIAGTIANLAIASGQSVDGLDIALMVSSEAETWIKLSVSEADVINLAPDQSATVSVDALGGEEFDAIVKRVDEFGKDNSGVVTYNVYLFLENSSLSIRPTMTVQVDVVTQNKDNVLVVPNSAIKPYQGEKAVQVISKKTNQPIYLPVETGIKGETQIEIISGLEEGQEIIIGQSLINSSSDGSGGIFGSGPGGGGK